MIVSVSVSGGQFILPEPPPIFSDGKSYILFSSKKSVLTWPSVSFGSVLLVPVEVDVFEPNIYLKYRYANTPYLDNGTTLYTNPTLSTSKSE